MKRALWLPLLVIAGCFDFDGARKEFCEGVSPARRAFVCNDLQPCAIDASCQSGQLCHPTAKVCVNSCITGSDCPSSAPLCDTFPFASGKFCQCSNSELCGVGPDSPLICSSVDKICEPKCISSDDCGGLPCDESTGECQHSTIGQTCNSTGTDPQPSICNNGEFCSASTNPFRCTAVPVPTCPGFTSGSHSWVATNDAPIIYSISKVSFGTDSTFCGTTSSLRAKIHIKAYSKSGQFPSSTGGAAMESILHYVRADGSEEASASSLQAVATSADRKNTDFDMNFCVPSSSTTFVGGLHFYINSVSGNLYCFVVQ